jgi:hypothetical protein
MFIKRCFVCGAREDGNNHCTNPDCPRYVAPDTTTETTTTETDTGAAAK